MNVKQSEIEIAAPAQKVWDILTDFARFPEWNPFMRRANGQVKTGERLAVYLQTSSGSGMTFRPTVLKAESPHELRWLGHLIIPGLFDGEHSLTIEPISTNRVRFVQREVFTGILVSLIDRMIGKDTQRAFEKMNLALKQRAEAQSKEN